MYVCICKLLLTTAQSRYEESMWFMHLFLIHDMHACTYIHTSINKCMRVCMNTYVSCAFRNQQWLSAYMQTNM